MRSALETLGKRVSLALESIDRLEQRNIRADVQLKRLKIWFDPASRLRLRGRSKTKDREKMNLQTEIEKYVRVWDQLPVIAQGVVVSSLPGVFVHPDCAELLEGRGWSETLRR